MVDIIVTRHQNSQGVTQNEGVIDVQNSKHPLTEEQIKEVLSKLLHVFINRPGHFKVLLVIMPAGDEKAALPVLQNNTNGELTTERLGEILTGREMEVLELLVKALHVHEIAEKLSITESAVCFHRSNIYLKLHIHRIQILISTAEKMHWFQ